MIYQCVKNTFFYYFNSKFQATLTVPQPPGILRTPPTPPLSSEDTPHNFYQSPPEIQISLPEKPPSCSPCKKLERDLTEVQTKDQDDQITGKSEITSENKSFQDSNPNLENTPFSETATKEPIVPPTSTSVTIDEDETILNNALSNPSSLVSHETPCWSTTEATDSESTSLFESNPPCHNYSYNQEMEHLDKQDAQSELLTRNKENISLDQTENNKDFIEIADRYYIEISRDDEERIKHEIHALQPELSEDLEVLPPPPDIPVEAETEPTHDLAILPSPPTPLECFQFSLLDVENLPSPPELYQNSLTEDIPDTYFVDYDYLPQPCSFSPEELASPVQHLHVLPVPDPLDPDPQEPLFHFSDLPEPFQSNSNSSVPGSRIHSSTDEG